MICRKCGIDKPTTEFRWDDGLAQGTTTRCRDCRAHKRCPQCKPGRKCETHRVEFRKPGLPETRYRIRDHALERFWERVRPDLERRGQVLEEMLRLALDAPQTSEPPEWLQPRRSNAPWYSCGYLHVADGVVFTLNSYRHRGIEITTVLTRDRDGERDQHPRPRWVATITAGRLARAEKNARKRAAQNVRSSDVAP